MEMSQCGRQVSQIGGSVEGLIERGAVKAQSLLTIALRVIGAWAILAAVVVPIIGSPTTALAATSTKMSITASSSSATVYRKVTLTATLKKKSGAAVSGRSVRLEQYTSAKKWALVTRVTTNSKGKASVGVRPAGDTKYRYRYAGSTSYKAVASAGKSIGGYKVPDRTWDGSGTEVIGPFSLEKGLAVFDLTSGQTDSNYIVTLLDADGEYVELLANAIGTYSGSRATDVPATASYYLEVTSDTDWKMKARQPRQLGAPTTRAFHADGTTASGLFVLSKHAYKFSWSGGGSGNFIVILLDREGNYVDLVANEIGTSSGSVLVSVPASSQYVLDIQSDGPWSVKCAAQ